MSARAAALCTDLAFAGSGDMMNTAHGSRRQQKCSGAEWNIVGPCTMRYPLQYQSLLLGWHILLSISCDSPRYAGFTSTPSTKSHLVHRIHRESRMQLSVSLNLRGGSAEEFAFITEDELHELEAPIRRKRLRLPDEYR
eukprot:706376-Rhodomonas_salina.1